MWRERKGNIALNAAKPIRLGLYSIFYSFFVPDDMVVPGLSRHHKVGSSIAVFKLRIGLQQNHTKFEKSRALMQENVGYSSIFRGQV
jgi:hypothetical protein